MSMIGNVYYPNEFNHIFIKAHLGCQEDLEIILDRSGFRDKFWLLYKQRLRYLAEKKENCVERSAWFENLKGVGNLHSIKIKGQKNIRILFVFCNIEGCRCAVLLHAFEEKDNKRQSKYSYDKAIPVAMKRFEGDVR